MEVILRIDTENPTEIAMAKSLADTISIQLGQLLGETGPQPVNAQVNNIDSLTAKSTRTMPHYKQLYELVMKHTGGKTDKSFSPRDITKLAEEEGVNINKTAMDSCFAADSEGHKSRKHHIIRRTLYRKQKDKRGTYWLHENPCWDEQKSTQ